MKALMLHLGYRYGWSGIRIWCTEFMLNELFAHKYDNHFCFFAWDAEQELVLPLSTAYAFMDKYS